VTYRYQQSLPRCLNCQNVFVQHAAKRLLSQLQVRHRKLVAMILLRNRGQLQKRIRSPVLQPASAGKEADLVNCTLINACYRNSEPDDS